MKNLYQIAGASLLIGLLATGCGQPSPQVPESGPGGAFAGSPVPEGEEGTDEIVTEPDGMPTDAATPERPTRELPDSVQPIPPQDEAPQQVITGEVPQAMLDEMMADLASRLNMEPGEIAITTAQSVTWNDGSLGCPQPGVFYTQALVDGYFVVLTVGEVSYNYHASQKGHFVLCENAAPGGPTGLGTPTS